MVNGPCGWGALLRSSLDRSAAPHVGLQQTYRSRRCARVLHERPETPVCLGIIVLLGSVVESSGEEGRYVAKPLLPKKD